MKIDLKFWKEFSQKYYQVLSTELSGLNLTALNSAEEIYTKQVLDSILPLEQIEEFNKVLSSADYIIDLGTGGGFPLLPIAKIYPNTKCVGVDARNKKLNAVNMLAHSLQLTNVTTVHATFQELIFNKPKIVFLVKAVGKTSDILDALQVTFSADIFFYKGANFYQLEIEEIEKLKNNEQLVCIHEVEIEGLQKRYIVHCKIKSNVPRGTTLKRQQKTFSKFV